MNKSDTHAFVNQLLVYTLVMICFTGSVGLSTVWFRITYSPRPCFALSSHGPTNTCALVAGSSR